MLSVTSTERKSHKRYPLKTRRRRRRRRRLSRVYRPTKHIIGHIGDGFYGSNDPTNSVKALKEVVVLRIGFNPTRSTHVTILHKHAMYRRRRRRRRPVRSETRIGVSPASVLPEDVLHQSDPVVVPCVVAVILPASSTPAQRLRAVVAVLVDAERWHSGDVRRRRSSDGAGPSTYCCRVALMSFVCRKTWSARRSTLLPPFLLFFSLPFPFCSCSFVFLHLLLLLLLLLYIACMCRIVTWVDLVELKPILRTTTFFSALTLLVGSFDP